MDRAELFDIMGSQSGSNKDDVKYVVACPDIDSAQEVSNVITDICLSKHHTCVDGRDFWKYLFLIRDSQFGDVINAYSSAVSDEEIRNHFLYADIISPEEFFRLINQFHVEVYDLL